MTRVKAGIINQLGEGIPPSNSSSGLNMTVILSSRKNSLTAGQLEPWSGENHQGDP